MARRILYQHATAAAIRIEYMRAGYFSVFLKAVRAVDLCQTLVECTEREMTGLAGYF